MISGNITERSVRRSFVESDMNIGFQSPYTGGYYHLEASRSLNLLLEDQLVLQDVNCFIGHVCASIAASFDLHHGTTPSNTKLSIALPHFMMVIDKYLKTATHLDVSCPSTSLSV
jgi:hypothetical protein